MRQPPARVLFLGHQLIAMPVFGMCGLMLYLWSQNPDAWLVGVGAIIAGLWTNRAQDTANQYRRWRKAWDGMAEPAAKYPLMPQLAKALIAVLVVGGFVLADQGGIAVPAGDGSALVGLVILCLPVVGFWMLVRRFWSDRSVRARATTIAPVTVAVRRAAFAVPSLEAAYRSLPEHSERAMRS